MTLKEKKAKHHAKVEKLAEKLMKENKMDNKTAHAEAKKSLSLHKKKHVTKAHAQKNVTAGANVTVASNVSTNASVNSTKNMSTNTSQNSTKNVTQVVQKSAKSAFTAYGSEQMKA